MNPIPEIIPISDIRQRQQEILAKLATGPIVLTQHGKGIAVLLDIQQWNQIAEDLEDLQDLVTILRQEEALARGDVEWEEVDLDELEESIRRDAMAA